MDSIRTKQIRDSFLLPRWIKVTKSYSDFSSAGTTNDIEIYSLSAKERIHSCIVIPTTAFTGGTITGYTVSVGIAGNLIKYYPNQDSFTGFSLGFYSDAQDLESLVSATSIRANAISTIGLLNEATVGDIDIYLLTSTLP